MKKILYIIAIVALLISIYLIVNKHHYKVQDVNRIIEQAIDIKFPPTNNIVSEKAKSFSDKAMKAVHDCDYNKAIALVLEGLKIFPSNFLLQSDLAALIGDLSYLFSGDLKIRMLSKSKELFLKLDREASNQPKDVYFPFKNEYFFRFEQYDKQYELGIEIVNYYWHIQQIEPMFPMMNNEGYKGYYSQGVGAAYHAKQLLLNGNKKEALEFAQKSLVAWTQYFTYKNDYYNAYVHYALALGILGYKDEMMKALIKSAAMIKKNLDYKEFKDVIDFVNNI